MAAELRAPSAKWVAAVAAEPTLAARRPAESRNLVRRPIPFRVQHMFMDAARRVAYHR
jgi:hypothetical protein